MSDEPEGGFRVSVDTQQGSVVLDLELAGALSGDGESKKVRLYYSPGEAAEFAMALVKAAQEAQKLPQPPRVVLPQPSSR